MLNRAVRIVRLKQPFLDWAAQLNDSSVVPTTKPNQAVDRTSRRRCRCSVVLSWRPAAARP